MTEPELNQAAPFMLSYHERRAYRASGKLELRAFLIALVGGLVAAVLSALLVFGWMVFAGDDLLFGIIIPIIGQGIIVGATLFFVFRWAKLRNAPLALGIGLLCAIVSAISFQVPVYIHTVHRAVKRFRLDVHDEGIQQGSLKMKVAESIIAKPYDFYDRFMLLPRTGHKGFAGFLRVHWAEAWGWIVFQVLALTIVVGILGWQASNRPFCETCGQWYHEPFTAVTLSSLWGDVLMQAVQADSPDQVLAVEQVAADNPSSGVERVRCAVHRCPKCAGYLAEILLTNQGKNKNKTTRIMRLHRVSTETVEALKAELSPSGVDV